MISLDALCRIIRTIALGLVLAGLSSSVLADNETVCAGGHRVTTTAHGLPGERGKVVAAACVVLSGVAAEGASRVVADPLEFDVVEQIGGVRLNAQYINPSWLSAAAREHVMVTRLLIEQLEFDALAFVIAHETAHRLNDDASSIRNALGARNVFALLGLFVPIYLLRRRRHGQRLGTRASVGAVAAGLILAGLAWTAATIAIAAGNTRFEYRADLRGIRILEGGGWPHERAFASFAAFIAWNGDRPAGSWLSQDRHPSDVERVRAVQDGGR